MHGLWMSMCLNGRGVGWGGSLQSECRMGKHTQAIVFFELDSDSSDVRGGIKKFQKSPKSRGARNLILLFNS